MKIRTRITFTSILLIVTLLLSSILLFVRFNTVYRMKDFQQDCVDLNTSMSRLIDSNINFFTEKNDPRLLSRYWLENLIAADTDLKKVLNSHMVHRMSDLYIERVDSMLAQWLTMYSGSITPYIGEINRFTGSSIAVDSSFEGFYSLLVRKEIEGDTLAVERLLSIQDHQKTLIDQLSIYKYSIDNLTSGMESEISDFISRSIILVFSLVAFIIILSFLVSVRFSRTLVRRIEDTNAQVEMMKEGSLDFQDEESVKDEFDELIRDYHYFSQNLSERLNSLKILFQDIGNSISDHTDIDAFQETIVELGVDSIGADSGMLFLVDSQEEKLNLVQKMGFCPPPFSLSREVRMVRKNVENYFETHPLDMTTAVFGNLIRSGEPLFVKDNEISGTLPYNSSSDEWLFISSFMGLPLIVGQKLLGMLVFYKTSEKEFFTDLDYTFIRAFADYTAQSIDNVFKYQSLLENREIEREIDIAASIQKRLLPDRMPDFSIGSARIHSRPARGISGDYFDAIRLDKDRIMYTVCDVAGKGVPASMLMIMIRTILHAICLKHKSSDTLLRELNYHIAGRIGVDQYATMAVFILDESRREISYSNAAHHPLYLFRNRERQFRSFDTEGLPIGVDRNTTFGHKRIRLHDQDYLFLFTDGLPEARDHKGSELSVEELLRYLSGNLEKKPEDLIPAVKDYIDGFTVNAKQHDDQTFLALQIRYQL